MVSLFIPVQGTKSKRRRYPPFVLPAARSVSLCRGRDAPKRNGCGPPHGGFCQRPRNGASCESGAEGEPHHRPEAVGSRNSYEIEAGYRRLTVGREHGSAFHRSHLRTNLATQDRQAPQINLVAGGGNDVIRHNLALSAILPAQVEVDASILYLNLLNRVSQQERHLVHHLVLDEPPSRRPQSAAHDLQPQALRQMMKCSRSVGIETGAPTWPE